MSISNIKGVHRRTAVICNQVFILKKKKDFIKKKFLISMYKGIYIYI